MHIENSVVDYINRKQLRWFGYVQRMPESYIPNGHHMDAKEKEGLGLSWKEGIDRAMRES